LERKVVGLIIFNVRESTMDEVKLGLETACKELVARGYVLESLASSIGIARKWNGAEHLEKTANELVRIMGSTVRLVYGYRECLVGTIGSSAAFQYGSIIPNFGEVVNALLKADFGSANHMI
jgi:hypothetical protein